VKLRIIFFVFFLRENGRDGERARERERSRLRLEGGYDDGRKLQDDRVDAMRIPQEPWLLNLKPARHRSGKAEKQRYQC